MLLYTEYIYSIKTIQTAKCLLFKSDTYRSFLRRGPSRCEGVCEIPLWEDQPASLLTWLHWWSDRGALPWPRLHTDREGETERWSAWWPSKQPFLVTSKKMQHRSRWRYQDGGLYSIEYNLLASGVAAVSWALSHLAESHWPPVCPCLINLTNKFVSHDVWVRCNDKARLSLSKEEATGLTALRRGTWFCLSICLTVATPSLLLFLQ